MNAMTQEFTAAIETQFSKLNKDVQDALIEAKTASGIALDLAQQMARGGGGDDGAGDSWGSQFAAQIAEMKDVASASMNGRRANFSYEMKATIGSGSTSGGAMVDPYRDGVVTTPRRALRVRSLLPVIGISTGSVEYPKQTTRTNAANTVAEGALKPESAYGFTLQTLTPKVIAHWVPAARQILDDAPQLRGIIDTELMHGLALKEDAQLLAGDGTGENLSGLITNATAYSAPFTIGSATMLDTIGLGMLQTSLADYMPTGIVMHPSDWMRIRLLKDADGKYMLGEPGAQVEPRLFGLPVVPTTSMTIDKFLIGDFAAAATLYDRWTPRIEVATEHADFFVRNMIAILCEERIALAVKQGAALTYGDFGNVA